MNPDWTEKFALLCDLIRIELRRRSFTDDHIALIISGMSDDLLNEAQFGQNN